jgi:hypothetical protein
MQMSRIAFTDHANTVTLGIQHIDRTAIQFDGQNSFALATDNLLTTIKGADTIRPRIHLRNIHFSLHIYAA